MEIESPHNYWPTPQITREDEPELGHRVTVEYHRTDGQLVVIGIHESEGRIVLEVGGTEGADIVIEESDRSEAALSSTGFQCLTQTHSATEQTRITATAHEASWNIKEPTTDFPWWAYNRGAEHVWVQYSPHGRVVHAFRHHSSPDGALISRQSFIGTSRGESVITALANDPLPGTPTLDSAVDPRDGGLDSLYSGSLDERQAIFVYETARHQAAAAEAPIVPAPWTQRDLAFRQQFRDAIAAMTGPSRISDPEEVHDMWWRAYEALGWEYGPEYDPASKTHPDMVPFDELGWHEQIKDAVFIALCEIARRWIVADPEDAPESFIGRTLWGVRWSEAGQPAQIHEYSDRQQATDFHANLARRYAEHGRSDLPHFLEATITWHSKTE
ncbi:RyR domain-containing protein [Mycobacteroides abscessus]|uniref:RyR domain-containing protein n=1 Tax=Mycobacteroides abscessus TaxID=36809 RepID=UPI000D6A7CED|nr:RyR domain-containing protein [Mycobacteroides abscessus]